MKVTPDMRNPEPRDWVVPDILARGVQTTLYGKPGVGKSLYALHMAAEISHAEPVLYLDYEMTPDYLFERLDAMHIDDDVLTNGFNYHTMAREDVGPLDTPSGSDDLGSLLATTQAKILFVDTMTSAVEGPENDNDTYRKFDEHTLDLLKKHNVTTMLIDHASTKGSGSKGPRGASHKTGQTELSWYMSKTTDKAFTLTNIKDRIGLGKKTLYLYQRSNPLAFDHGEEITIQALTDNQIAILERLEDLGIEAGTGRVQCIEALQGTGAGYSEGTGGKGVNNNDLATVVRYRKQASGTGARYNQSTLPDPF